MYIIISLIKYELVVPKQDWSYGMALSDCSNRDDIYLLVYVQRQTAGGHHIA